MSNKILYITLGVIIVIGVVYALVIADGSTSKDNSLMTADSGNMTESNSAMADNSMIKNDQVMIESDSEMDEGMMTDTSLNASFMGEVLGGDRVPVLDFTQADYEKAIASDDLIVLYFYANWCPLCKAEIPEFYEAMAELETDEVVAFRVNFNDNQTDDDEVAMARRYGVAYQHTKVFVKDGERVLKSPESWDKDRYLTEVNNFVN
ncbi:MAG: thioredoxin family protein [Candidatus Komeilibacteria bacterium]|nr:thioredoxin family protein [Candidatus Komeilibacteria bacterium]